ncbi:MAG: PfkB family carbohydrate kinase [Pseudomonadales bacterium]
MTEREQQILNIIKSDPMISQQALADMLDISRSAVASHINNLNAKGIIKGRGYVIAEDQFCVAVGGANIDILGLPDFKTEPETSTPGKVSSSLGGVGRNIAENIARLGDRCYLIAPVGNDARGKQLIEQSTQAGILTSHMITLDGHSTSCYLSIVDEGGEMQLAVADMDILEHLTPTMLKKHLPLLHQAKLVVADTNLSPSVLHFLFEHLPEQAIFVDTVSVAKAVKILPFLSSIHTLKPNLLEAQTLAGFNIESDEKLPTLAQWFHDQGVKRIFISLGARGVYFSNGETQGLVTLPPVDICNTNGAGDAMMAALCHSYLDGKSINESAYYSLAAANSALSTPSTINPNLSVFAIEQQLKDQ